MNRLASAQVSTLPSSWRYAGIDGRWDEAVLPSGFPRSHWRRLSIAIGRMGFDELTRCWNAGQHLIQANGISYNVGSDPQNQERPWPMDPLPLLIAASEWRQIEAAVVQRATLLNLILRDLYGQRRLLHGDWFPPELLFPNPHFWRACDGLEPGGGVHLHSYAADLGRSADGSWWVIADRTQSPAGMGYALENRLVSARTLPNIFSQHCVRPLAPFVDGKRDTLLALASRLRANPRIVLLTAGPHSETYFEHSFLAGQWGFPLVEGADLTVRENHVYLKTLGGLEPVDLILRWMSDSHCDPLELRGDSLLGVPGLLQAVRSGTVIIDNALGTGVTETTGLLAFLPGLCRHVLGSELLMPSVATWWCGQETARRYVLEHFDDLVILPAFPSFRSRPEAPAYLGAAARQELVRRIEAQPELFCAQEKLVLSTTPVRAERGLEPAQFKLRVFAAWNGESYSVMPGSLTRVSEDTSKFLSMHASGGSKDTWVLSGRCEPGPLPCSADVSQHTAPVGMNLPCRVADSLFWLGRYAERVEGNVRLVRALLPALSGENEFRDTVSLETAVQLLIGLKFLPPELASASLSEQLWRFERFLTETIYDRTRHFGLGWNLKELRRVAWNLKERLSSDTWRVLQQVENDFVQPLPDKRGERYFAQMALLDRAIITLSAFSGLLMENTTRGYGWRFLEIGRRLERALQVAELLQAGAAEPPLDNIEPHLQLLLRIADSSITYRTRYMTVLRLDLLLELLLVDPSNPRSVGFQLAALIKQIEKLPRQDAAFTARAGASPAAVSGADIDGLPAERHRLWKLLGNVRRMHAANLSQRDAKGRLRSLEEVLQEIVSGLHAFSDMLTGPYLSHVTAPLSRSSL
jgi:uncharacterized circularly permuted ATP-grasp superfamily protein/uncharacterized alpha-E superfamily protein